MQEYKKQGCKSARAYERKQDCSKHAKCGLMEGERKHIFTISAVTQHADIKTPTRITKSQQTLLSEEPTIQVYTRHPSNTRRDVGKEHKLFR